MTARRRIQRSVRVTVAVTLTASAALVVAGAIVSGSFTAVATAAAAAVLAGGFATRMVYGEVLATRRDFAHTAAAQARSHQQEMAIAARGHLAYRERMSGRVLERDLAVSRLSSALSAAQRHAADAQSRADEAAGRARREARDAAETRRQLARLLDEVFGTALVDRDVDRELALVESVHGPDGAAHRSPAGPTAPYRLAI